MPSTLVHLAIGALLAAGLLRVDYDARALGVVLAATAVPDLDTFLGIVVIGTHRAALHTLLVPIALGVLVYYDTRVRDRSFVRRWGPRGVRVAWVAIAAYAIAGIGPDLFTNGVNVWYPLQDRFVALHGNLLLTDQRGFVQTLWQPAPASEGGSIVGSTQTVHYRTGVDTRAGPDPPDVERIFPIARGGLQVLVLLAGLLVTSVRLWETRRRPE